MNFSMNRGMGFQQGNPYQPETERYFALHPTGVSKRAIDANIRAIKYGSGITLSSLTFNIATTATGLITGSSVDLRPYSSTVWGATALAMSISDGTNTFTATPGAAGTGETYATDILNPVNLQGAGWDAVTATITGATTFNITSAWGYARYLNYFAAGSLYYGAFIGTSSSGAAVLANAGQTTTWNSGTSGYKTAPTSTHLIIVNSTAALATITVTSGAMKKVLTPDATGLVTSGGSGASFNPNAATKSITITKAP